MTVLAAMLWLHAAGFYSDNRFSWQLFPYASMAACESDVPRRTMWAEGLALHGITTECRETAGREA